MADHSRVARLAAAASEQSEEKAIERLDRKCVHVSFEPQLPGAWLAFRVAITTLRRMPGRVHIDPRGTTRAQKRWLEEAIGGIDPDRGFQVGEEPPIGAIHLHIGTRCPSPAAIRAVPDGYGVHVARDSGVVLVQARPGHPLGSVVTAAFGVGEAFKDAAPVVEGRRQDHAHLTWCPVSLSADLTAAPMLDRLQRVRLALAGCGAIGTAIALILSELAAEGEIQLMDRQTFGAENIPTYSIGGRSDLGRRKVDVAEDALRAKWTVTVRHGDLESLVDDVDQGRIAWPRLVLTGLDSVPARHAVQRLWPDRIIDAATGGTVVGLHDAVAGAGPCLMCFFPGGGQVSAETRVAELTGLSVDVMGRDGVLREEDIAQLEPDKRMRLAPHLGKPICNLAKALGLIEGAGDFQAAVTFVAMQAACLSIGRLIATQAGMTMANFVQYDSLIGPGQDIVEHRKPDRACHCQEKATRIARIRATRAARAKRR